MIAERAGRKPRESVGKTVAEQFEGVTPKQVAKKLLRKQRMASP